MSTATSSTGSLPPVPGRPASRQQRSVGPAPLRRRLFPTPAEAAGLRFLFPMPDLRTRWLAAGLLFAIGLAAWSLAPILGVFGLVLVLLGHLPLWVRSQTTAPGGATPQHEENWAPVEDDWMERVERLEEEGKAWDASPWDLSSGRGFLVLVGVLAALVAVSLVSLTSGSLEVPFRLLVGGAFLVVPLWLNGMRTTWNPSELRKKGKALEAARRVAKRIGKDDFDAVPLLALREGARGHYPVDARLMLRPAEEDETGFLGVQVQVAMNNVRGTDYPYLYAVVLGKTPFEWPPGIQRRRIQGVDVVFERGGDEGVAYMVVRQHADDRGGWHTNDEDVGVLVETAVALARQAHAHNLAQGGGR